ncbi:hypothetical protein HFO56_34005 [Rhizobium laguerreae]|uniref:hypothetical protein n=1 Tax=Rhizobium laguerreae TaxID=1076926 RepID=UPI001C92B1BB|nr:hypothetical protein [Rhizobium laguerreae]MBY3157341.1 hypothetical protein [Rhizobium laguerreae]
MSKFSEAEVNMLLSALRIGAEDGSLFGQNSDGTPNRADVKRYDRVREKLLADRPRPSLEAVAFKALSYGAKFQYSEGNGRVWVKIGHDLVAEWDSSKVADTWIGQSVCSFSEDGDVSKAVYLLPEQ